MQGRLHRICIEGRSNSLLGDRESPKQAIVAAQLILGPEWTVILASPSLKPSCLERLKLHADEIRELSVLP